MTAWKPRTNYEKDLITIFTRLAKDVADHSEGGKIFSDYTIRDLPVKISIVWGEAIKGENDEV
jgi:hypothetical protein